MREKKEKLAKLMNERKTKVEAQQAILKKVEERNNPQDGGEQRNGVAQNEGDAEGITDEEFQNFETLENEIRSLTTEIDRLQTVIDAEARNAALFGEPIGNSNDGESRSRQELQRRFSLVRALSIVSNGSLLDGVEAEVFEEARSEMDALGLTQNRDARFAIPSYMVRSQSVSNDNGEYGGDLVDDNASRMVRTLFPRLKVEEMGGTVITGLSNGSLPLVSGNNFELQWAAEGQKVLPQKTKFKKKFLSPKRAAVVVDVSNRLLIQSSHDVENLLWRRIGNGMHMGIMKAVIEGSGTESPLGILNMPDVNVGQLTGKVGWSHIIELETLVDDENAFGDVLQYLISNKMKGVLKQTRIDPGSGKMVLTDQLNGYKYQATKLMPDLSGNEAIIFGDWSEFMLGQWGGVAFKTDPFSKLDSDETRLVLNTYLDFGIANPKAFAINKGVTLE